MKHGDRFPAAAPDMRADHGGVAGQGRVVARIDPGVNRLSEIRVLELVRNGDP